MIAFSDDDALAAEYVLGTLDEPERLAAEVRRHADPIFDRLIREWEDRLAPLVYAAEDIVPPSGILARVLTQIAPSSDAVLAEVGASNVVVLRRKLRVWRGVAAVAGALAAALALWVARSESVRMTSPNQTYVAVLQQGSNTPSFVVSIDLDHRRMTVMPLAAKETPGKSYELWMIGGEHGVPQSLGVVDAKSTAHPPLPSADPGLISHATYAVTLEPAGGSPTGQPTSAPLFTGRLLDVPN